MDCWQLLRNPWWTGMTVPWDLSLVWPSASTALAQTQVGATQNATYSLTCATPRAHNSKLRSLHWPSMDSQGDCTVLAFFQMNWEGTRPFHLGSCGCCSLKLPLHTSAEARSLLQERAQCPARPQQGSDALDPVSPPTRPLDTSVRNHWKSCPAYPDVSKPAQQVWRP